MFSFITVIIWLLSRIWRFYFVFIFNTTGKHAWRFNRVLRNKLFEFDYYEEKTILRYRFSKSPSPVFIAYRMFAYGNLKMDERDQNYTVCDRRPRSIVFTDNGGRQTNVVPRSRETTATTATTCRRRSNKPARYSERAML